MSDDGLSPSFDVGVSNEFILAISFFGFAVLSATLYYFVLQSPNAAVEDEDDERDDPEERDLDAYRRGTADRATRRRAERILKDRKAKRKRERRMERAAARVDPGEGDGADPRLLEDRPRPPEEPGGEGAGASAGEDEEEEDPALAGMTRKEKQRELRRRRERERARNFAAASEREREVGRSQRVARTAGGDPAGEADAARKHEWEKMLGERRRFPEETVSPTGDDEDGGDGRVEPYLPRISVEEFVHEVVARKSLTLREAGDMLQVPQRTAAEVIEKLERMRKISGVFLNADREDSGEDDETFWVIGEDEAAVLCDYVRRKGKVSFVQMADDFNRVKSLDGLRDVGAVNTA